MNTLLYKFLSGMLAFGLGFHLLLAQSPDKARTTPELYPLVDLYELDGSGKHRSIDTKGIVNINSTIRLEINTVELGREIARMEGISDDSRFQQLDALNQILQYETKILRTLNELFAEAEDQEKIQELSVQLTSMYVDLLELIIEEFPDLEDELDSDRYSTFKSELRDKKGGSTPTIVILLEYLSQKATTLAADIEASLDPSERVYFRLGAFLKNSRGGRPIHVENFDDYDEGDYKEFSQFGRGLSSDETKALKKTEENTQDMEVEIDKMKDFLENRLDDPLPSKNKLKTLIATIKTQKDSLDPDAIDALGSNITGQKELAEAYGNVEDLIGDINLSISSFFSNPEGGATGFGDKIIDRVDRLETQVLSGFNAFENAYNTYDRKMADSGGSPSEGAKKIYTDYSEFKTSAEEDLKGLKGLLVKLNELLNPFRKTYLASEKLGEEVLRFTAGTIPQEGYIDLKYIGERRPGDEVLIKAVLEKGVEGEAGFQATTVMRQFIKMERIAVYSRLAAGLVLANPYLKDQVPEINTDRSFLFSPSFSIFFKWGSRKSRIYNELLAVGLGLSFTSPDFDLNGAPEFGAGVIVTGFRDILSAGWGWNFGLDTPYYYVGFNIPFNFPGGLSGGTQANVSDL